MAPALAQVRRRPSYSAKTWRQRGQRSETRSSISLRANATRRSSSDFAASSAANCSFKPQTRSASQWSAGRCHCAAMLRRVGRSVPRGELEGVRGLAFL